MEDFKVYQASGYLTKLVTDASDVRKTYEEISGSLVEFDTYISAPLAELVVDINPVQDLHGQDAPYPAGGGKNILPQDLDSIKASNTDGTWNGNVYTRNNVTFTVQQDSGGNITGILINASSAASANTFLNFGKKTDKEYLTADTAYVLSGCPSNGGNDTYRLQITDSSTTVIDTGSGVTFTPDSTFVSATNYYVAIRVASGYQPSNVLFKPMICLSSASNPTTFAPYSNICPITGWTGCEVWVKDEYDTTLPATASVTFPDGQTVYGGEYEFVSGDLESGMNERVFVGDALENWAVSSSLEKPKTLVFYISDSMNDAEYSQSGVYWLSNELTPLSRNQLYENDIEGVCVSGSVNYLSITIRINKSRASTVEQFKEWLSNNHLQFVYKLATPITYQLTPQEINTLIGVNNIWADTGDVSVKYRTH